MRLIHSFFLLIVFPAFSPAQVVKTFTESKEGEVVALTDKEIRLRNGVQETTIPLADVLLVDYQRAFDAISKYHLVKLIDGSELHCRPDLEFALVGKNVDAHLTSGAAFRFPASYLHYILFDADQPKNREEFNQVLAKKSTQDVLRLLAKDRTTVNTFEGFVGDADDKGQTIQFKRSGGNSTAIAMDRVRGIIFDRKPGAATPAAFARLYDTGHSVFVIHKLISSADGFQIATPCGLELGLRTGVVQKIDFSLGKLAYLSDLEPLSVQEAPILANAWHYRRDRNLEGGPLSVGRKTYRKGLSLHSRTILTYDIQGYNLFRAIIGIDDTISGYAHALVRIEGDDRELFAAPVTTKDKPRELSLNIAGVKRLRITVDYGDDLDLGDHVDFVEARVTK